MKVAVMGNCQAQAMQSWLATDAPSVEVIFSGPTYSMGAADEQSLRSIYGEVDYIFMQRVDEDSALEFLKPSYLSDAYPEKYVSWPNVYFDGYFPGMRYLYSASGKITGPVSDYHFQFIIDGYLRRDPVETVAAMVNDAILDLHPDSIFSSLTNLALREKDLHVGMSDFIGAHLGGPQMFYAMNHPTDEVLRETLERLLGFVGERKRLVQRTKFNYTLDEIQVPAFPAVTRRYGLGQPIFNGAIRGKGIQAKAGRLEAHMDHEKTYDWLGLVQAYYRLYEANGLD